MSDTSYKRPVIVGIFVFIGLVVFMTGILMIGNLHETFKRKIKLTAVFNDVNGLQQGNNVWFSGVKVGTVSKLEFVENEQVRVELKVEEKAIQYIHKNSYVKISTDGLIGNKILVIYGGTATMPGVEEGDMLGVEKTFTSEDMINTLQKNNENLLLITDDFKSVSADLAGGKGTVGKLLKDEAIYDQLNSATVSLQNATIKADHLLSSLNTFSNGLNKKGTLANQLTTDTVVFNALKSSMTSLQHIVDTASIFVNTLNAAGKNSKTPVGVLLHDEETGARIKQTITNLESSSLKLNEDLEAMQHSILLRRYFKKKNKKAGI